MFTIMNLIYDYSVSIYKDIQKTCNADNCYSEIPGRLKPYLVKNYNFDRAFFLIKYYLIVKSGKSFKLGHSIA